ncbi:hypothetical protein U6A24_12720 [Aquimarina gracilis]|uniref:Uncharacterized protein n=1 Tax=Aquimarina gracilis TaxID=874422 RepID=A0ABU5ZWX0_9FLAO|nr:hypothetical protein [Aquimarina gracilis]MEB3346333.1 hypothetical protein [Aquimarina gracilis]
MKHHKTIEQLESILSGYQSRLEKLLKLNTEQLRHYSIKKYSITREFLERKIDYYQKKVDTLKASDINVNSLETV